MHIHVQLRLTGGRAEDYYGSMRLVVELWNPDPSRGGEILIIRDGENMIREVPDAEWESYLVRKTDDIPRREFLGNTVQDALR